MYAHVIVDTLFDQSFIRHTDLAAQRKKPLRAGRDILGIFFQPFGISWLSKNGVSGSRLRASPSKTPRAFRNISCFTAIRDISI